MSFSFQPLSSLGRVGKGVIMSRLSVCMSVTMYFVHDLIGLFWIGNQSTVDDFFQAKSAKKGKKSHTKSTKNTN